MTSQLDQRVVVAAARACRSRGYTDSPVLVAAVLQKLASPQLAWNKTDLALFAATNNITIRTASEIADEVVQTVDTQSPGIRSVDVVAVTALGLEARAVESFLSDVHEVVHPTTGTIYRVGRLIQTAKPICVATLIASDGNPAAASETERALAFFTPAIAVFVGVAGGLKDDIQKGDVVAASYVYDYSSAKEGDQAIQSRVKTLPASYGAVQRAQSLAATGGWADLARTNPQTVLGPGEARAFVKPIAAGPKLLASSDGPTAVWIREHCGDALAVEMEGFGFHVAAHAHPSTQALVIRGISDTVDDKTSKADMKWQPIAASRAAAFALSVARDMITAGRSGRR